MYDEEVKILENSKVNEKYFKLVFSSKNLSCNAQPGQFLHIQINQGMDPFLRRAFSYYRIQKDRIEVLYEIMGKGTEMLSRKMKGSSLKIMGPLGRPFTQKVKKQKRILVAGGVGVPPLVFLAEKHSVDYFLVGTKSRSEVMPAKEMKKVSGEIIYSTNDGSYGRKGFVTLPLQAILKKEGVENVFIQTCGPKPMIRAVMDIASKQGVEGEASIDQDMACGVGACLGCMVKTTAGWQASCVCGPVFNFKEIVAF